MGVPKTEDGKPITVTSWEATDGLDPIWHGRLYTATAGTLSIFDELVESELRIRGGWYSLMDGAAAIGDYVECSIVDKNDLLGYFTPMGLSVANGDVLELKKYVRKEYICPSSHGHRQEFTVGGAFPLMPGLYIRTMYNSVGNVDVKFKSVVFVYE